MAKERLGRILRQERIAQMITLEQAAKSAEISMWEYLLIEGGEETIPLEAYIKACEALGMKLT